MSPSPARLHSKHRLEALSDGVFAVVLTLLVLELRLDHLPAHASNAEALAALRGLARPFFGYVLTFVLTSVFWILQHRKFALLEGTTAAHIRYTLVFLFGVTLLPLSVSLFIRANQTATGTTLYFANMAFLGGALLLGWREAGRDGLIPPGADPAVRADLARRIYAMAAGATAAALVSIWLPQLGVFALAGTVIFIRVRNRRAPVPALS